MQTTHLVQNGIYAIVRHPQYLAGILVGIGLSLVSQHWLVILPGIVVIGLSYAATFVEERQLVEKFPGEYEEYQKRVPRVNFISGILRRLFRKK
jgi:protein-S-isoprenylcysteine O-methyltransferase Ste14